APQAQPRLKAISFSFKVYPLLNLMAECGTSSHPPRPHPEQENPRENPLGQELKPDRLPVLISLNY
ncbi:MAG: hypothetical protein ACYC0Q_10205, partial [Eubacteriales bacterium]